MHERPVEGTEMKSLHPDPSQPCRLVDVFSLCFAIAKVIRFKLSRSKSPGTEHDRDLAKNAVCMQSSTLYKY